MKKLYAIRDVLAGFGSIPGLPVIIDGPTDSFMIRVVKGSVAKGQKPNVFNVNPEDKELWCVGEFDQDTGVITAIKPYLVCKAIDYLNQEDVSEVSENENSVD